MDDRAADCPECEDFEPAVLGGGLQCGLVVIFVGALLAGRASLPAQAQHGALVHVPNESDDTIPVIDIPTRTVQPDIIGAGANPAAAEMRGDQSLVYVTNTFDDTEDHGARATRGAVLMRE